MAFNVLSSLSALYAELPAVPCRGCGQCCVCPTCMLSEFIFLIDHARRKLPEDTFAECIVARPCEHTEYEGNLVCVFLDNRRCTVHDGRAGGCRLFGFPAMRDLNISGMVYCRHDIDAGGGGPVNAAYINTWLEKLCALENSLYPIAAEPYFVKGFNLHCWLDIYFDATFDDIDVFADIRRVMQKHIDLTAFAGRYGTGRTGLKEKVDKITILSSMQGRAEPAVVRRLLESIRDDYPFTGTYYTAEAQQLIASLVDMAQ